MSAKGEIVETKKDLMMKTDRLYALTLYLLNHGKSSASELARHFDVSVRTIQRDIDALCQAGIPICAFTGTNGGYEILSDFRMNNQLASEDEYAYIATAINGLKTVTNAIAFWKKEYQSRYYVRWAIIDKNTNCVIGAIELFNRKAKDYFNNCGLLRLDLRSDYERQDAIEDILGIIIPETRDMFACEVIATKAVSIAQERIQALEHIGFYLSEEFLIGHDGKRYDSYYVLRV